MIPPETVHLCSPHDPHKFIFKVIYIDNSWISETFSITPENMIPLKASLEKEHMEKLKNFCTVFENETEPLKVVSVTVEFFDTLFFSVFNNREAKAKLDRKTCDVKNYIDLNFTEELKLDDLCKIANTDKYKLIRRFSREYKLTPHSYITNKRIVSAKEQLLKGKSVAETAVSAGFFDQSHFIKTFRSYTGINPGDYKGDSK